MAAARRDRGRVAAGARIQITVVSGRSPAMIPSGGKGPRWASVNSTGTCAAADSQPKTDTHGGDSGGQAHRLAVFLGRGR